VPKSDFNLCADTVKWNDRKKNLGLEELFTIIEIDL
jgi:hypothetical protein